MPDDELLRRCLLMLETWQAMEGDDHCTCNPPGQGAQCVWCDLRETVAALKERLNAT